LCWLLNKILSVAVIRQITHNGSQHISTSSQLAKTLWQLTYQFPHELTLL